MSFANPIWLFGLTALAVPVVIHLLNRQQSRLIYFGSLRHLRAYNTRQSFHLRLNEIALLLLRCAIIVLLVLLLSRLHNSNPSSTGERWIVVESGLHTDPGFSGLIDSLKGEGYRMKFLAPDFPNEPGEVSQDFGYWDLANALEASPATHVVVLSYGYAERYRGKRIRRPAKVTWISKQPPPAVFALDAVAITVDSVVARQGNTSVDGTTFNFVGLEAGQASSAYSNREVSVTTPDTLRITVASDTSFDFDRRMITAAIRAIDESIPSIATVIHHQPDSMVSVTREDWVVWLSQRPFTHHQRVNCIVYGEGMEDDKALTQTPNGGAFEYWTLNKRLDETVLLEESLMLQLAQILGPTKRMNRLAAMQDRRAMPEEMIWATGDAPATGLATTAADRNTPVLLAFLLLATLVSERLLAIRRGQ